MSLLLWLLSLRAAAFEQTWRLQAGWQSVFMEVAPLDRRPEVVFEGLTVEGVWTWPEKETSVDYLQDPGQPLQNPSRWLVWRPAGTGNTLTSIEPGRSYIIKVLGGRDREVLNSRIQDGSTIAVTNVFWRVAGRPVLPSPSWPAYAYSLRGLPVDDGGSTTVAAFFISSPSHFDISRGRPHGVWTLETQGRWRQLGPEEPLIRGRAYWIRTESASDFVAPLRLESGSGGDFGTLTDSIRLSMRAVDGVSRVVSLVRLDSPPGPLMLARNLPAGRQVRPAPVLSGIALRASGTAVYELVADRAHWQDDYYETVYVIRDNRGSQYHLPVRVERPR